MNDTSSIRQPRTGDEVTRTLLLLAGWFFFAIWLGVTGKLNQHGAPPIGIGAAILAAAGRLRGRPPAGQPAVRRTRSPGAAGADRAADLPHRSASSSSSPGWAARLPAGFALPAGLGDMAIGLAAPLRRRRRHPPAPASPRARADLERSRRGRSRHRRDVGRPPWPIADWPPRGSGHDRRGGPLPAELDPHVPGAARADAAPRHLPEAGVRVLRIRHRPDRFHTSEAEPQA